MLCLFKRKFDDLSKECDLKKDEFGKFEQQDVRCREDIKHAHVKKKKLEKSLEQEEKKVISWIPSNEELTLYIICLPN